MIDINGTTRVCGLIGNPVGHSISPVIHNSLARLMDMNMVYTTFKVEKGDVVTAVNGAYALNILGLNVTVPHKQAVMESLVDIDPLAKAIGAVNTLVRTDKGYKGYNTDILGLERELIDEGVVLVGSRCVILGAGGAARAIAFLCAKSGAKEIYMLNRTKEKAYDIAKAVNDYFGKECIKPMLISEYDKLEADDYVVIQTTSVGLYPNVDDVVIDDEAFYKKVKVGVDIIYNPSETRFMKMCKNAGKPACNGLKMLLYQGVAAYELWNDVSVTKEQADKVYNKMKEELGSGKTTFGRWVSRRHNRKFYDTDEYIEKKQNTTISEIFATKGEEAFRDMETETVKELSDTLDNCVISVGGGLVLREVNRELLRKLGTVVYLKASEEELCKRLSKDTKRPLLQGGGLHEKIHNLMEQREDIYLDAADMIVDTQKMSFEQMYTAIIKNMED